MYEASQKVHAMASGMFATLQMLCDDPQEAYEVLVGLFVIFHCHAGEHTVDEICGVFAKDFKASVEASQALTKRGLQ